MPTKSNKMRRMPIFLARGKYYTRIRWGNDKTFRGDVKFPLDTPDKLVAEHRRDKIQDSSLRGKIISAYDKEAFDGVGKIKDQIDWFSRGATLVDSEITLSQAINEYNDYCIGQRLKNSTIEIYLRALNEFAEITKVKRIDRIKKMHFTRFKRSMVHLSEHTVNRKLRSLQTFFNWMLDEGLIDAPVKIKKLSVINPPVNYFSNAEFEIILQNVKKGFPHGEAAMGDDDRELFVSAYRLYRDTGLRLAEPFNNELKRDDEGYRLKIVGSVTKNSYQRFVHLTEQQAMTVIQMNEWLDKQLETRKNRYETIKVFSRVFSKALRMARLKGKLHDLRKTFATRLYFLTGQEFTLCYALGHTDTSMTKQYTNLDKVELNRAIPDIVAMRDSGSDGKNLPRGDSQGDTELYSNFGFMHVT
jgi:integrase